MSAVVAQRTMSAGRLSIIAFQIWRALSYASSCGRTTRPVTLRLSASILPASCFGVAAFAAMLDMCVSSKLMTGRVSGRGGPGVLIEPPALLRMTPELPIIASMDALSDALRVLRLTGAVFLDAEFTTPWCVLSTSGKHDRLLPSAGPNLVFFHVLTEGRCKARLASGNSVLELAAGDLLMLPRDDNHLMGSDLHLSPTLADTLVRPAIDGGMMRIEHGGGGEKTRFVCGFLRCDERLCGPLLEALPSIMRVPLGEGPATAWLRNLLYAGTAETSTPRPGGETVLTKLSELLFVEALRRYIELLPEHERGWLAALRDRFVGRALALMHDRPGHPWTVEELAENVGLSRS